MAGKKSKANVDDISLDADDFALGGMDISLDDTPAGGDDGADFTKVDIEGEAEGEINAVLAGFKDRAKREDQRFNDAVDSEFWVALYFQNREQKDEFLAAVGWDELGDKYIDGMEAADMIGIELKAFVPPMPAMRIDQKLVQLAHTIGSSLTPKRKRKIIVQRADE